MAWIDRLKTAQHLPQSATSELSGATAMSFLSAGRLGPIWLPQHPGAGTLERAQDLSLQEQQGTP